MMGTKNKYSLKRRTDRSASIRLQGPSRRWGFNPLPYPRPGYNAARRTSVLRNRARRWNAVTKVKKLASQNPKVEWRLVKLLGWTTGQTKTVVALHVRNKVKWVIRRCHLVAWMVSTMGSHQRRRAKINLLKHRVLIAPKRGVMKSRKTRWRYCCKLPKEQEAVATGGLRWSSSDSWEPGVDSRCSNLVGTSLTGGSSWSRVNSKSSTTSAELGSLSFCLQKSVIKSFQDICLTRVLVKIDPSVHQSSYK